MFPLVNVKVLLDGLYDRGCSLNMLKRDKDGIARDYSPILENIWELTTKWPNWEVLNKSCVILIIVNFIINVGLAGLDASTDINDTSLLFSTWLSHNCHNQTHHGSKNIWAGLHQGARWWRLLNKRETFSCNLHLSSLAYFWPWMFNLVSNFKAIDIPDRAFMPCRKTNG